MAHAVIFGNAPYDLEELCPHCDQFVAVRVDRGCPHLEITCPYCGNKMMICADCDTNRCNWSENGGCRMDQKHRTITLERVISILQDYVDNDLGAADPAYVKEVLTDTCGCSEEELDELGFGWMNEEEDA